MGLSFNEMKMAVKVIVASGHVPNIIGLQGIGKSDLVKGYAEENGYPFCSITCSLMQEGDLAMPYISKEGDITEQVLYAINRVITNFCEVAQKTKGYAILFLDEFNRALPQVQSELMNLVLQREILGYSLAPNVRIVLAMNPSSEMSGYENTEYSVSYSDAAIMGRVVRLDMVPILSEWLDYGSRVVDGRKLVHPVVQTFLSNNNAHFVTPEKRGHVNSTPRGWKRVSDIIYSYEAFGLNSIRLLKEMVVGTIAESSGNDFIRFYKSHANVLDYNKLARSVLNASSPDEWDPRLEQLSDIELDKLFHLMADLAKTGSGKLSNFVIYVTSVQPELMYSWGKYISETDPNLYDAMLEYSDFSSKMLKVLGTVKTRESGGFSGKPRKSR